MGSIGGFGSGQRCRRNSRVCSTGAASRLTTTAARAAAAQLAEGDPDQQVEADQRSRPRRRPSRRRRSARIRRRDAGACVGQPGGQGRRGRLGARCALGLGGARRPRRPRPRAPAPRGARARSLLTARRLTGTRPSCAAARRRRRRTSRGGTGSRVSGPFSTAATNRSPPCSAHVTSGARVRSLVSSAQSAHAVGVHEVEPLVLDAGEERACPPGTSTVFQPMWGTTGAWSRSTTPGPLVAALGLDAVLDTALEEHLHADADARAPGDRRRGGGRSSARR